MRENIDFVGMRFINKDGEFVKVVGKHLRERGLYIVTDENGFHYNPNNFEILEGSKDLKYDYIYEVELRYIMGVE